MVVGIDEDLLVGDAGVLFILISLIFTKKSDR
jgi:hypothetical protein